MEFETVITFAPEEGEEWACAPLPTDAPPALFRVLGQDLYCAFQPLDRGLVGLVLAPQEGWQAWRARLPPMPRMLYRTICELQVFLPPQLDGRLRLPLRLLHVGQIKDGSADLTLLDDGILLLPHRDQDADSLR